MKKTPKAIPESWLASDNPEEFADAMMRCMGHGAPCNQDGFCHLDGACFDYIERRLLEIPNEMADLRSRLVSLEAEYLDIQIQHAIRITSELEDEEKHGRRVE